MLARLAQKQQPPVRKARTREPAGRDAQRPRGPVRIDRVVTQPSARARVTTRVIRWLCRSVERHFENSHGMLRLRRQLELFDRARGLFGIGRSEPFTWDRGALNGVRVRIVHPASAERGDKPPSTLMYLHGGAFLLRTLNAHMDLAAGIARAAGLQQAVLPIYRLAPESPYPAAIDDCLAAYVGLLNRGIKASRIALGGDSAGGGLVLKLLMRIREHGLPMPSCGVLISPFTDMSCSGRSITANAGIDPMFGRMTALHVRFYLGATDPRDPLCSPLFGRFEGLPPLMAQVGSTERLLDDTLRLAPRVRLAGGQLQVEVWNDMPHVWQAMALPESAQAIGALGRFIAQHLRRAGDAAGDERPMNIAA
jgi:monoterpene epsilon-lactone hydrolase